MAEERTATCTPSRPARCGHAALGERAHLRALPEVDEDAGGLGVEAELAPRPRAGPAGRRRRRGRSGDHPMRASRRSTVGPRSSLCGELAGLEHGVEEGLARERAAVRARASTSAAGTTPASLRAPRPARRSAPDRGARRRRRGRRARPRRRPCAAVRAGAATSASRCRRPASNTRRRTRPGTPARGPPARRPRASGKAARGDQPAGDRHRARQMPSPVPLDETKRIAGGPGGVIPAARRRRAAGRPRGCPRRRAPPSVRSYLRRTRARRCGPSPSAQRPRWAAPAPISPSKKARMPASSADAAEAQQAPNARSRSPPTRSSRTTVWRRAGAQRERAAVLLPANAARRSPAGDRPTSRSPGTIRAGPQVLVVTEEAASRPSRTVCTKRASANSRRSVCASLMLCELISTSPGLPSCSRPRHRRSRNSRAAGGRPARRGSCARNGRPPRRTTRLAHQVVEARAAGRPPARGATRSSRSFSMKAAEAHAPLQQVRHPALVAVKARLDRDVGEPRVAAQQPPEDVRAAAARAADEDELGGLRSAPATADRS